MYLRVISEFNIGHKKNSIHYPVEQFFSAILKAAKEADTRTLSGSKLHSLLAWYRNEWRP